MKTALVVTVIGLATAALWAFQWDYRIESGYAIRINRFTSTVQQRSCYTTHEPLVEQRKQRAIKLVQDVLQNRKDYTKLSKEDQILVYGWLVYNIKDPGHRQELGLPSVEEWERKGGRDVEETRALFVADESDEQTRCVWEVAPSNWPQPQPRRPWF